jgi:serine/threonine-protein kinase
MAKREDDAHECPHCGYIYSSPYLPSYLAPGTVLSDRYIVGKLKSYNGESAKYIAFDTITEEKVLIKEYMPDAICSRVKGVPLINVDPAFVAQYKTLLSEFVSLNKSLSKMRSLNHVAAVFDMFGGNNTGYAVFEYQTAKTMAEYLKENAGEISWDEAKKLIPPLLTTVSLIHNAGIIHRGISPANVLINEKKELILTGFAISEVRTSNTVLAGELYAGYSAPEQYNSANWHDTWTDVYGVCALIYRMLTGITPVDALIRTTSDSLVPPNMINQSVPKSVSKAIMQGMTLSHEMRVQTITELVTLLFDQPDYKSERLSSSSTTSIPLSALKAAAKNGIKPSKTLRNMTSSKPQKKRVSRKKIFAVTAGITLVVGICGILIYLLINVPDGSSTVTGTGTTAAAGEPAASFSRVYEPASETEITTAVTTTAATTTIQSAIFIMSDIVGLSFEIVSNTETYTELLVFKPEYEFSDTVPMGDIISQSVPKDSICNIGDSVNVVVSKGPRYAEIPDFIGLTADEYFAMLNRSDIKYEAIAEETNVIKENYVVRTDKNPGEMLDNEKGEILTVYVAKNTATVTSETSTQSGAFPDVIPYDGDEEAPDPYAGEVTVTYYNY